MSGLTEMGPAAHIAVPLLESIIADPVNDIDDHSGNFLVFRLRAASVLASFGASGKGAVPYLISTVQQNHEVNARSAIWALRDIGPEAMAAVPAIRTYMQLIEQEPDRPGRDPESA
jgi:hypothetical protein